MNRYKIIYIAILIFSFISHNTFADEKLLFSIDLIRHGDRNPTHDIPKSIYPWKEGLGGLTAEGIAQEIHLGQKLRKQYVDQYHLLPETYDPSSIYVRSTNVARTIKSAKSFMLGLYPLNTRAEHPQIPLDIVPKEKDNLLVTKPSHNIFSMINYHFATSHFWKEQTAGYQSKLKDWSEATGAPLNNFKQLDQLADNLYVRQCHHVALPTGISAKDAEEIIALSEIGTTNEFKQKSVTNSMGQEFIKTVSNYMQQVTQHKTPLKYVLLSGHDSSIMSLMNTLGTPLNQTPDYASHVNFSLINNDNRYYVKISYNDKPVLIPACKNKICTLEQFSKFASGD